MKSSQTIFNTDETVTISHQEYEKLLQYKQLCQEYAKVMKGDSEWISTTQMS